MEKARNALIGVLIALLPPQAGAADAQWHYTALWSGVPIGEAEISFDETATAHEMRAELQTTGVAGVFAPHHSVTTVEGEGNGSLPERKRVYACDYGTPDEPKRITLDYGKGGAFVGESKTPSDPPGKRPAIATTEKSRVPDPLTYFLTLRHQLKAALSAAKTDFRLRYYDGLRLAETPVRIVRRGVETVAGKKRPVIVVSLRREAVDGFTAKELKRLRKESELTATFSDDDALMPLEMRMPLKFGTLVARLQE